MTIVTLINTLAVKPDRIDEFISVQNQFATAMSNHQPGLIGGRMYRNLEGSRAVLVSQFESTEAQLATTGSAEFKAHLAKIREMVDSSNPDSYEVAYTYGVFK
jgi:heme-degrading monooxygenase HmoA